METKTNGKVNKEINEEKIDFSRVYFVGVTLLRFTVRDVGHMTLKEWFALFGHYRKHHNFKIKGGIYKLERKPIIENQNEWLPF